MNTLGVTILLEYIYSKFLTTFIMCLMGSFIKETVLLSKKYKKIHISKVLLSGFFSSIIVCVIADYIEMPFSVYTVVCVLFGMWGYPLIQLFLNANFIKKLLAIVLKNVSTPLSKYAEDLSESIEEINNQTNTDNESDNIEKKEGES